MPCPAMLTRTTRSRPDQSLPGHALPCPALPGNALSCPAPSCPVLPHPALPISSGWRQGTAAGVGPGTGTGDRGCASLIHPIPHASCQRPPTWPLASHEATSHGPPFYHLIPLHHPIPSHLSSAQLSSSHPDQPILSHATPPTSHLPPPLTPHRTPPHCTPPHCTPPHHFSHLPATSRTLLGHSSDISRTVVRHFSDMPPQSFAIISCPFPPTDNANPSKSRPAFPSAF
jgi:hypothetical protein